MSQSKAISKLMIAVTIFAAACSSHKQKDPNAELKKSEAWVDKLPVEAGKSVEQVAPTQRIHLVKVKEFRKKGDAWWLAADGFARVNNEIMPYFWKSPKAPNLEVTFDVKDAAKFEACKKLIESGFTQDQVLELYGEGEFAARMMNGKYLGVFKLVVIRECELLAKDSYSMNDDAMPADFYEDNLQFQTPNRVELVLPSSSLF